MKSPTTFLLYQSYVVYLVAQALRLPMAHHFRLFHKITRLPSSPRAITNLLIVQKKPIHKPQIPMLLYLPHYGLPTGVIQSYVFTNP